MLKKIVALSLVAGAVTAAVYGQATTAPASQPAPKGLKEAYAGKFLIGSCAEARGYTAAEQANMAANYDVVTPENSMKPDATQPREGNFTFTTSDALVKWASDNKVKVWGHCLAWHSQTPGWFFQAGADGKPMTKELAMERLKKHIDGVVGHFKGKVIGWDVVNEAINDRANGTTEDLRQSNWVRAIGPEYLTLAFKYAREADPDVKLIYNDYSIEQGNKLPSSVMLLKRLIKEGAPITGVGIQGHWHLDTDVAAVEKAIKAYGELGLKVSVTEMDVTASGTNSGALGRTGASGPINEESYKKQAVVYAQLFDVFKRNAAVMERVTLWGMSDGHSWRSSQMPLLFTRDLKPKPALLAVLGVADGTYEVPKFVPVTEAATKP